MSFRPRTILRLRSRTSAMSMAKPSCVMPNSLLRRKYDATFALWKMFLLGKHAMFGHDTPMYLRSTTATCFPSPAKVHAAMVEPVPPPRITRSNSSNCVFMRIFLSERRPGIHRTLHKVSEGVRQGAPLKLASGRRERLRVGRLLPNAHLVSA